jgi:hypothetical protein
VPATQGDFGDAFWRAGPRGSQAILLGIVGGCRPGLLAQRSRLSMTFSWLGRRGFGAFGSSDSFRGSLMSSVMAVLQAERMRFGDQQIKNYLIVFIT